MTNRVGVLVRLGRCPSTVQPVFPMFVFQLSKQQNRTRTTSSTHDHTRNPSEPCSDKEIPLRRALRRFAFLVGFSTGNPPKIGTFTAWSRTRNRTRTPSDRPLSHQNRTIAIASDFRVEGAKSPEIPQKEGVLGSEIATRNCKSLATLHRILKSQCEVSEIASDFWGPRLASQ